MAEACLFDNRIRANSLIIPEKFFVEQESVSEDIYIKGKKTQKKALRKTITNIPSHGWEIEMVKHVDTEIVSPYLTWGKTLSNNPVEVKVPLPTVAISQRIWRFYGFRITLDDILKPKILAILKSENPFEISLLKSKIFAAINDKGPGYLKIDLQEYGGIVWISVSIQLNESYLYKATSADIELLKYSDKIKSYIENL